MTKIGIFGGAFNPIHLGHISIARQAFDELKLKKLLIIPSARSPHKDSSGLVAYEHRAKMCELAFNDEIKAGRFEICDIEQKMGGTSYTINTVRALKHMYPSDTEFYLLIGGDMLFYFEKWYRYEALLGECKVTAAAREVSEYADMCEYAAEVGRIKVLNLNVVPVSSTQVRNLLADGGSISELVPAEVEKYIKDNRLYAE